MESLSKFIFHVISLLIKIGVITCKERVPINLIDENNGSNCVLLFYEHININY